MCLRVTFHLGRRCRGTRGSARPARRPGGPSPSRRRPLSECEARYSGEGALRCSRRRSGRWPAVARRARRCPAWPGTSSASGGSVRPCRRFGGRIRPRVLVGNLEALELGLEGDLATPVPGRVDARVVCEQGGRDPVGRRGGAEDAHYIERLCHHDRFGADTRAGNGPR